MTSCVEWPHGKSKGYGIIRFQGVKWRVHRLAWHLLNGVIPKGKLIRHSCDNPSCYNIEHLEIGTQQDNMDDRKARGREFGTNKTHCKNGHEFDEKNTRITPRGTRACRACHNARMRKSNG